MTEFDIQQRLEKIRRLARPGSSRDSAERLEEIGGISAGKGNFPTKSTLAERLAAGIASRPPGHEEKKPKAEKKERKAKASNDRKDDGGLNRGET